MLQFVDPNVLLGDQETRFTRSTTWLIWQIPLTTQPMKPILAKQLINHGANVNAVTSPQGETPLQKACRAT
jgi:hypothetical protein